MTDTTPKAISIADALAGRPMLDGRRPDTPAEEASAAFATLADFREGSIFTGRFRGESPWERHRMGDELVHILDGATTLTIVTDDGPVDLDLKTGMLTVVPQGCWHRFKSADGVTVLTATPQPTDHTTELPPGA
ncbi:MAG: cupin domain-containing protein [Alphaproteobacteria bacterium]